MGYTIDTGRRQIMTCGWACGCFTLIVLAVVIFMLVR